MSIGKELKAFLMRGNVIDLAVGVVIGAAFGKIVDAVVKQVLTPIIGILCGGYDFSSLSFGYEKAQIGYGIVIQEIINFVLIGTFLFFVVKAANRMQGPKESPKPKEPSDEVKLLTEIRDSLKK